MEGGRGFTLERQNTQRAPERRELFFGEEKGVRIRGGSKVFWYNALEYSSRGRLLECCCAEKVFPSINFRME